MSVENEILEEEINAILGPLEEPPLYPVIDYRGEHAGYAYAGKMNFFGIVDRKRYPEIFERLRGKVIVMVRETRVRICDTLDEAKQIFEGVTHVRLQSGPPIGGDMTLEELEGRD